MLGVKHFSDHLADLLQRQNRPGERIERRRLHNKLGIGVLFGEEGQRLNVDIRQIQCRSLRRNFTDKCRMKPGAVRKNCIFGNAVVREIRDHTVVSDISVEPEGSVKRDRLDYI